MTLHICASFAFDLEHQADALLQFEVAATHEQRLIHASTQITGSPSLSRVAAQDGVGERIWLHAAGQVEVRYSASVAIGRTLTALETLAAIPLHRLPGDTVKYLLDSRYCHASQFTDFTQMQFGTTSGGARVAAIRDWVAAHVRYAPGASGPYTSATDTFHTAQGICRDFAQLCVTLARASAIPARYVACYAPGVTPQDFHAVAQVFLAPHGDQERGAWHMIDATGMADLARAAIIGVGRDACDVSFLTGFGPMRFHSSTVTVELAREGDGAPGDHRALPETA